jgi:hypothetical protein
MKKVLVGFAGVLFAGVVYANCTNNTITTPNGKMVFCQTCCYNGNCTTTCF